jgi:hypothetical protein
VANVLVAMDAQWHFIAVLRHGHLMHGVGVAIQACVLRNSPISWFDLDGFVEVFQSERKGMVKTVVGLGPQFAEQMMRQMTIVADGNMSMT